MSPPPPTRALYLPPGQPRRPRALALPTYRLTLTRENDGATLHSWSQIPHDKIGPLLHAMKTYLPFLAKAAAAKAAFDRVMDLFS